MSARLDTNHRWIVWRDPGYGDPHPFGAFDERADADAIARLNPWLTVREHLGWLPTTTVRVVRGNLDVRLGQMYPAPGEILVIGSEPVGRGMVIDVADTEFAVAVPVLPPARGDGPSLWEIGLKLNAEPQP